MKKCVRAVVLLNAFAGFIWPSSAQTSQVIAPASQLVATFPAFPPINGTPNIWTGLTLGLYYEAPTPVGISYYVTPSQVSRTFSWSRESTPQFETFTDAMMDGQDELIRFTLNGRSTGNSESVWLTLWNSMSMNGIDLQGFDISRIDMRVDSLVLTTPGRDWNGNGIWTDISLDAEFLIYAQVPEPTTFTLLGFGSLALVMVRRRR